MDRELPISEEGSSPLLFAGWKVTLAGALVTGAIALGAQLLVGIVSADLQAQDFLNTLIPGSRSLASSIVTASATILALMLTILGLGRGIDRQLETRFYNQIENIARFNTFALAGSILLLLLFNFPIEQQGALPGTWYSVLYYVLIAMVAGITSLFVGTILMLYHTAKNLIHLLHPQEDSMLAAEKESREE